MSTQFTCQNETVATRFWNGAESVVAFQMSEREAWNFRNTEVESESGETWDSMDSFRAEQERDGRRVTFMTASDMNSVARQVEEHRFFDEVDGLHGVAADWRTRARFATRDAMRVA